MQQLNDNDDAAMRIWWWLRSNIKDGLLLSICQAVLEEDMESLEAISRLHYTRRYGVAEVSTIACNKALVALGITDALRIAFLSLSIGDDERSCLGLLCEAQNSRLHLKGKGEGYDRTEAQQHGTAMLPESVLAGIHMSLVAAVEAKLNRC